MTWSEPRRRQGRKQARRDASETKATRTILRCISTPSHGRRLTELKKSQYVQCVANVKCMSRIHLFFCFADVSSVWQACKNGDTALETVYSSQRYGASAGTSTSDEPMKRRTPPKAAHGALTSNMAYLSNKKENRCE